MAIFDKILGRKEREKPAGKAAPVKAAKKPVEKLASDQKKSEPIKPEKKVAKEAKPPKVTRRTKSDKKAANLAHLVLSEPLVTEKSTSLGQLNKYVFRVDSQAGKNTVRQAVEDYYGVQVLKVNIIKIRPKKRIQGRTVGFKKGYKKAIVTLQAGDTIGFAEGV